MNASVPSKSWPVALATYLAAKAAEDAYDRDTYMPAFRRWSSAEDRHGRGRAPAEDRIPDYIEAEIERLQGVRHDAEDVLMAIPSPDALAFVHKVLVARGEGRGCDGWDGLLEAEANRLIGESR